MSDGAADSPARASDECDLIFEQHKAHENRGKEAPRQVLPTRRPENCTSVQVQFSERDSNMVLQFSPRLYFQVFFLYPVFYAFAKLLNPPRHLHLCLARLLNSISRVMLMRRIAFPWLLNVMLVAFSLAACGGYSSTPTVNGNGPVAPYITTPPANQTVTAGQTATFSVAATGTPPLTYRWQKNGADITGATSSSYSTPVTTAADDGEMLRVVVSNAAGSVTSNSAILTVNAGTANSSVDVITYHYDNGRSGQNLNETSLTLANVTSTQFGKKGEFTVDGKVDAQPLYLSQVAIGGQKKNVLYVATEHGSVYAFDGLTGDWHHCDAGHRSRPQCHLRRRHVERRQWKLFPALTCAELVHRRGAFQRTSNHHGDLSRHGRQQLWRKRCL